MTVSAAQAHQEMVYEVSVLARRMVSLEETARKAHQRGLWTVVGELHDQRREVQERRSEMLRFIWQYERHQAHRRERYE